jgi:DNA-binding response OmpR family regulator
MVRILIVEDEAAILMALEDDLRLEGYEVETAVDGPNGLAKASKGGYDLVILDVMLPEMDGFEVCRQLRSSGVSTPVLMLTAKSQEIDKVLGLELGADDYVTKPFSPRELLARVKALLRRAQPKARELHAFTFGDVEVDFRKYEALKAGESVDLTAREFALLRFLIERRDEVVDRMEILDEVWDDPASVFPRTVDAHVAHLRKKLEDDPANPRHLLSVRGVGYRFAV